MSEATERARKYRALLFKYGENDIAFTLNDDALYDLMYSINWLGEFYQQDYREAQNNPQKMDEVNERFTQRAEQLLQKSGYSKKEIEEKLAEFKDTIMSFCGVYSRTSKIFREYFDKNTPWDDYYAELDAEILEQKDNLPKFISKGINPPKVKTSIEEKAQEETRETKVEKDVEDNVQGENKGAIEETSIGDEFEGTQIGSDDIAKLAKEKEITSKELAPVKEKGIKAFFRKMINKIKGIGE